MTPSGDALELLKEHEQGPDGGFAPTPYRCPAGHLTVGWGHRVRRGETFPDPLTAEGAEALLRADLERIAPHVAVALRRLEVPQNGAGDRPQVTQSMFDAIVSLGFNIGVGALLGSTLMRRMRVGDFAGAAEEFLRWDKARDPKTGKKVRLAGLVRRRKAERALFLRDGLPEETTDGR